MKAYHYETSRGREVLYCPGVFAASYLNNQETVNFNPDYLRAGTERLKKLHILKNRVFLEHVHIDKEDIEQIVSLCFCGDLKRAADHCFDVFDDYLDFQFDPNEEDYEEEEGLEDGFDPELGYDPDGFDGYLESF
jgi:hypothetical protein